MSNDDHAPPGVVTVADVALPGDATFPEVLRGSANAVIRGNCTGDIPLDSLVEVETRSGDIIRARARSVGVLATSLGPVYVALAFNCDSVIELREATVVRVISAL